MANSFSITLSNGTKYENFKMNGNNFITTDTEIAAKFNNVLGRNTNYLTNVTIEGDADFDEAQLIGTHAFMEIVQCVKHENEWWIVLRDLTKQELRDLELDSRIAYLEMITEEA